MTIRTFRSGGVSARIVHADSLDYLAGLPDASIDAVITDPPYGLAELKPGRVVQAIEAWARGERDFVPDGRGFMGVPWDSFVPPPAIWDECLRVLKPGGHLAAFAGSRTYDIMGLAVRMAGFEIRDGLVWLYGQGMPKGQKVGRAVHAQALRRGGSEEAAVAAADRWDGWDTTLKPAHEPIVLARKPLAERTVAANLLEHGAGGLHVDAIRVQHRCVAAKNRHGDFGRNHGMNVLYGDYSALGARVSHDVARGRHPANLILSHAPDCRQVGVATVASNTHHPARRGTGGIASSGHAGQDGLGEHRPGSEQVEEWECAPGCPVAGIDEGTGVRRGGRSVGGASRFFHTTEAAAPFVYAGKPKPWERPSYVDEDGKRVHHVSVKPLAVMDYLVRMLTPAGGVVLDPFAGSGTTVESALRCGFDAIGVEREAEYLPLIEQLMRRIDRSTAA